MQMILDLQRSHDFARRIDYNLSVIVSLPSEVINFISKVANLSQHSLFQ